MIRNLWMPATLILLAGLFFQAAPIRHNP